MIPNPSKCSVCDENIHSSRDCPCLYSPLKEGFYSGGGGGGGHSHDEDERAKPAHPTFGEDDSLGYHPTFGEHLGQGRDATFGEDESIQVKRIPFYSFQSNKHSRSVQNIPKTILTHTLFQEHLA